MGEKKHKFPSVLIRKIGTLIGRCKNKEPDLYSAFIDVCNATGQKPTDVLMNFMAWFIEQGGMQIMDVGSISKQKRIGETFAELDSVKQIADMAKQAIAENLQREMELKQTLTQMSQEYMNIFSQLQNQIIEFQKQITELKAMKQQIEKERQEIEAERFLLEQRKERRKRKKE